MKMLPPKTWHALGTACVIGFTAAIWFAGIQPLSASANQQTAEIKQRQQTQRQAIDLAKAVEQLRQAVQTHRAMAPEALPIRAYQNEQNQRINQLIQLTEAHGVNIESLTPETAKAHRSYVQIPIEISGTAPYPAFVDLLGDLHQTFPDMRIDSFELTSNEDDETINQVKLTLVWFVLPDA